jgi:hypothetical protein
LFEGYLEVAELVEGAVWVDFVFLLADNVHRENVFNIYYINIYQWMDEKVIMYISTYRYCLGFGIILDDK